MHEIKIKLIIADQMYCDGRFYPYFLIALKDRLYLPYNISVLCLCFHLVVNSAGVSCSVTNISASKGVAGQNGLLNPGSSRVWRLVVCFKRR